MTESDKLIKDMGLKIALANEVLSTEKLLKKYMKHMMYINEEGCTTFFTDEEVDKLKKIENEILEID